MDSEEIEIVSEIEVDFDHDNSPKETG